MKYLFVCIVQRHLLLHFSSPPPPPQQRDVILVTFLVSPLLFFLLRIFLGDCRGKLWHYIPPTGHSHYIRIHYTGRRNKRRRIGSRCRTLRWIDSSRKWAICSTRSNFFLFLLVMCHDVLFSKGKKKNTVLRRVTNWIIHTTERTATRRCEFNWRSFFFSSSSSSPSAALCCA